MRAAIYARKSNDDNDTQTEENKSVTRQIEQARHFAEKKGWTVAKDHIYVDDGITGGEEGFKKRDGLKRMLAHLKEFDCIVMSEQSRLGRHNWSNGAVLHQINKAGVELWFYLGEKLCKLNTAADRGMATMIGVFAEMEREVIGQRTRDALAVRHAKGFNCGGSCYGYDNVRIMAKGPNGQEIKSHTDYTLNEEQAAVIRGIFRAYADGYGFSSIGMALNGNANGRRRGRQRDLVAIRTKYFNSRAASAPLHGKRGVGTWSQCSVRDVLRRERYRGFVPFGGKMTARPDLRIIDEKLWDRVRQRLGEVAKTYVRDDGGRWWGRPSSERYLLTGMGHCKECRRRISAIGGEQRYYACGSYVRRGAIVCANGHREKVAVLDTSVIEAIAQQVLTVERVAYVSEEAAVIVERELKKNPDKPKQLADEARKVSKELERFLRLIAEGKAPDSVLVEIRRREERLRELEHERAALVETPPAWNSVQIREMCGARLRRFGDLLRGDVPVARTALRKLLAEPLRFFPATVAGQRTLGFEGVTVLGPLFDPVYKGVGSPSC